MRTVLACRRKEVSIGEKLPTVIIGERINPSGKNKLSKAIEDNDFSVIEEECLNQIKAGAEALDINVGVPNLDEEKILPYVVQRIGEAVEVPLVIDSANPRAIAKALKVYQGKVLVNSVTAEENSLNSILPVVAEHGSAVVGLCMSEGGVPNNASERLKLAEKILRRANQCGIGPEDVLIDPVVMAVGTDSMAAVTTLESIRLVSRELGLNTCIGASNISFGLPNRNNINIAFISLAIAAGVTSIIMDPTDPVLRRVVRAADMLVGRDEWGQRYLVDYRTFCA